ncbi:uncharacterized protein TrAtP1_010409 [Trichoderma atroviride]|uniref:uncharacterized protein n=1 Tax=Hypocrea atroviridis TaxID=63577 RepID=UPI00332B7C88|nr:hypothetical protein TrAtP1_010409 [Trichoderma atroviride]
MHSSLHPVKTPNFVTCPLYRFTGVPSSAIKNSSVFCGPSPTPVIITLLTPSLIVLAMPSSSLTVAVAALPSFQPSVAATSGAKAPSTVAASSSR